MLCLIGALGMLFVGAGAYLYFGGYTDWQTSRSLKGACQGILPRGDLTRLLSSDDLRGTKERIPEAKAGWLDGCAVEAQGKGGGTAEFSVGWADEVGQPLSALGRRDFAGFNGVAAPLGGGWPGTLSGYGSVVDLSTLLRCRAKNKSLLVSARWYRGSTESPSNDVKAYRALAAATTRTALRAAERWGCEAAQAPDPAQTPAQPPRPDRDASDLSQAVGACRPLTALAPKLAEHGVHMAVETPASDSLIEDCYLLDGKRSPIYRLSAYYGPYARDLVSTHGWGGAHGRAGAEERSDFAWATADCASFFGTARFTSAVVYRSDASAATAADIDLQRQLVSAFAKDAASRHHCSSLETP
ncbi:hypothetical protein ACX9I7_29165 [Streptomyces sp. L500]